MRGLKEKPKKLRRYFGRVGRRDGVVEWDLSPSEISIIGKVTSKGQVTIPSKARRALNINAGDEIIFEVQNNNMTVRKLTVIDTLASKVGLQLRQEFPNPGDLNSYLDNNRKELFEKIYGDLNDKGSD